ncbi:MAG: DNA primase [Candidatus Omnitrophica bacterium]|nr:DNA primase [Candidatus Omnitrophota bacterium]
MIPNEIIDQILDKTDIVEIISGYVPMKRAGQNFKGRCPFHEEKTPSFIVSPAKQIYHCFGCSAGGNVISFLMKHERMEFLDALTMLADKANIALPRQSQADRGKSSFADKLYGVNNMACDLYRENLTKEDGKTAYRYFIQRGITESTIKHFRLGYAADSWQGVINHCKSKNIDLETLQKAGLVLQREDKKNWYDRFRNRIIFPIFDLRNRVLGFGARTMGTDLPKYMNSPETHIYTKGKHLYGLNFSKEYIRKQDYVIIVEGYFDLILPFQNDIRNIVATLGTALTPAQVQGIKRFTKNAIMIYDSDKAGEAATLRGLDLLIAEEMNVRIALLPKGRDPDSFVRKEARPGFMKLLKESKDLFDYKLGVLTAKFQKNSPQGKARIVGEMLPTLAKIKNAVLKAGYLKKMSEELSIDEKAVRAELEKVKPEFRASLAPYSISLETVKEHKKSPASLAEITLLAIALDDAEYLEKIKEELGGENFKDESIAAIFKKITELRKEGKKVNPSHLICHLKGAGTSEIISEAVSMNQIIRDKEKALNDCVKRIKGDSQKLTLHNLQSEIKKAENAFDTNKINRLIAEYSELIKEFKKNGTSVKG